MTISQVITALPDAPNPATMSATEFSNAAAASVLAQKAMTPELNTFATQANALAVSVNADAAAASNSAAAAATYETNAATSATAAALTANAAAWVAGTYALNAAAISPLDGQTYRNYVSAGVRNTDPASDAVNWVKLGAPSAAAASDVKTGTDAIKVVTSAAVLGALGFSAYFQSTDQTITSAGALTIAHGLGRSPVFVQAFLKNVTPELAYSAGDITPAVITAVGNQGALITFDATNIYIRYGSLAGNLFPITHKTSGASSNINNANWLFFVRALA